MPQPTPYRSTLAGAASPARRSRRVPSCPRGRTHSAGRVCGEGALAGAELYIRRGREKSVKGRDDTASCISSMHHHAPRHCKPRDTDALVASRRGSCDDAPPRQHVPERCGTGHSHCLYCCSESRRKRGICTCALCHLRVRIHCRQRKQSRSSERRYCGT
ncbi:hypothetical protein C8J57DRAFT_1273811 [Mycena rebaudengoi]|nr:hypothetical protein C8J57DRAFT_1273811 [Mycena rebaudengoi]